MIFNDFIDDEIRRKVGGRGGGRKEESKSSPPLAGVFIQGLGRGGGGGGSNWTGTWMNHIES